ncbi:MAG: hypothetical protein ABMA02_08765 [Saprospiraceae bacterium]
MKCRFQEKQIRRLWHEEDSWFSIVDLVEVQTDPNSPLNYDNTSDTLVWTFRRTARRTKEIGDIFVQVFGQGSRNTPVRPVFGYQVSLFYSLQRGLTFLEL